MWACDRAGGHRATFCKTKHHFPTPFNSFSPCYKHLQVSVSVYIGDGHAVVELGGVVVVVGRKDALGYSGKHGLRSLSRGDGRQEQDQPQQHPRLKGEKHTACNILRAYRELYRSAALKSS